jgi:hypothetical protein
MKSKPNDVKQTQATLMRALFLQSAPSVILTLLENFSSS